uniref:Uncharacterized protein n=1 Tax=Triticum urartu TaxID=4572 RepID=A0A8R7K074_TRIUA
MSQDNGIGEVVGRRVALHEAQRIIDAAGPEQYVEDDIAREGVVVEAPAGHFVEQVEHERVQAAAPVEPEQEQEGVGPDGAPEALELAEERGGGAEAGREARGGGEDAVEGRGRVEVGGAAGAPEEEGEREGVGRAAGYGGLDDLRRQ